MKRYYDNNPSTRNNKRGKDENTDESRESFNKKKRNHFHRFERNNAGESGGEQGSQPVPHESQHTRGEENLQLETMYMTGGRGPESSSQLKEKKGLKRKGKR